MLRFPNHHQRAPQSLAPDFLPPELLTTRFLERETLQHQSVWAVLVLLGALWARHAGQRAQALTRGTGRRERSYRQRPPQARAPRAHRY